MAIVHVIIVITGNWTSNSWDTVTELLALAVNSKPTERLANTSAGIKKTVTWEEMVKIREVDERRLELVFGGRTDAGERAKMGKEYE